MCSRLVFIARDVHDIQFCIMIGGLFFRMENLHCTTIISSRIAPDDELVDGAYIYMEAVKGTLRIPRGADSSAWSMAHLYSHCLLLFAQFTSFTVSFARTSVLVTAACRVACLTCLMITNCEHAQTT